MLNIIYESSNMKLVTASGFYKT